MTFFREELLSLTTFLQKNLFFFFFKIQKVKLGKTTNILFNFIFKKNSNFFFFFLKFFIKYQNIFLLNFFFFTKFNLLKFYKNFFLKFYKKFFFLKNYLFIVQGVKMLTFSFAMYPIAFAALGIGVLFASYNIAVSRNPEEGESMFSTTMMAFALIETCIFMGLVVSFAVYFIL
jgi:F0F1-type ATP synthase membrane subunit c/vacuolar-type H+-ATPase subunit K